MRAALLRKYSVRRKSIFGGRRRIAGRLKAPVGLIVHSFEDINSRLAVGRPFFMDIIRDGITLYKIESYPFVKPKAMPVEQRHKEAQTYFDAWYALSLEDLALSKISFGRSEGRMNAAMRKAAFLAPQATEHIYHCLLLTLTLYSPKLHNLHDLRRLADAVAPELADIRLRSRKFYKRSFARLLRAYAESRYSPHYEITAEELQWLYERVELLQSRVKELCKAHLQKQAAALIL